MARGPDPLRTAIAAALKAGAVARRGFRGKFKVELKSDDTPVTAVDRACEEILRRDLMKAFPGDGLVGEEYGTERADAEAIWIVDPIDGTKSFIRGVPFWGNLIAREVRGKLTLGVMYLPALDELYVATRGGGAWHNRRRLRVSRVRRFADAQILHAPLEGLARRGALPALARIGKRARTMRGYGDCWAYTWLVKGSAEAMIETGLNPWDVAAVKIIVDEAGGRMTGWDGTDSWRIRDTLASNGHFHPPLLRLLRR
ncbi:MAG: inositol monophosphatase family protein [bacterium]